MDTLLQQKEKSIVVKNYDYKLTRFLNIHQIKFNYITDNQIEIFYNTEYHLFNIAFHYGRFFQLQND